jgi:hypothetical protein
MKKHLVSAAGILVCATLYLSATPVSAADVGISVVVPGVYVQERPPSPENERDWRERQERAYQWREEHARERHDEHDNHDRRDDGHDRGHDRGHDE